MLSLKDVRFNIGDTKILNGVTFDIAAGSLTGLIGPNGCGKTTLFNCISGFASVTAGKVLFEGEDITALSPHERALHGIGRVFQNFGIFREQTILENMLVALESRDSFIRSLLPSRARLQEHTEQAVSYLKKIHLDTRLKEKAGSLSGGQMRLLEIIRTLAFGAKLFLLDEPTAGVSPRMKDDIINIIQELKTLGKTVLIIEHDMSFIQSFVERIVVMNTGTVFIDDVPERIMKDERLKELYFGKRAE